MATRTWKRRLIGLAATLALLAALAAGLYVYARSWTPPRADYPMQGIAVSAVQGSIAWPTLKARGVDFAYLRATGGDGPRDPAFLAYWQDADSAGIGRGAIHAYSLCRPVADQATDFIAIVPREENALPPAIEFAFDPGCRARPPRDGVVHDVTLLVEQIEAHAGKRVILHMSRDFEAHYRLATAIDRNLWLDRDFLKPVYVDRPWVMWQASGMKRIEGIDGPVNWNVIRE